VDELKQRAEQIRTQARYFQAPAPDFGELDLVEAELRRFEGRRGPGRGDELRTLLLAIGG